MAKNDFINDFIQLAKDSADGIHAVSIVDISSGMSLGSFSDGTLDPDVASAYNVEVVKAKLKAISALGLKDTIEDILITLSSQYHLIACTNNGDHMIYLAADRKKSNLAILRNILNQGVDDLGKKL